jgi:hypothetical protein
MSHFRQDRLPAAEDFYPSNLNRFRRVGRHKAEALCPFHPDHNPSLSIDLQRGLFHCFGCNAGGDIPGFVMERDGCDFPTACKTLGCWDAGGRPAKVGGRPAKVRRLVMDFVVDGIEYRGEIPDQPKSELQQLRGFYAEAVDRLTELRQGDAEKFEGEEEAQWGILAASWELIRMEVARAR